MLLHEAVQDELSERAWGQRGTSPSSQMGLFSRHGDFQTLLGGHAGQLRQCFGHAFIYHDPFFSSSVANLKMFNAFRFLVIFKDSWSVSVLFFFLLSWSLSLTLSIFIFFSISYCQVWPQTGKEAQSKHDPEACPFCVPFAQGMTYLVSARHKAPLPSYQVMGPTARRKFF